MSMQTFAALVMAQTPEEKQAAEKAHKDTVALAPTDAEVIAGFLRNCTTMDGEKIVPPVQAH